jgi:hypothetical protein
MPRIINAIDTTMGHCHPPQPIAAFIPTNVYSNGAPVIVRNSSYTPTTCGDTAHIPLATVQYSSNVFAGGLETLRDRDFLQCGDSAMALPVTNVYVNGAD